MLWVRKGFFEFPHTLLLATCLDADPKGDAVFYRTKIKIDGPNHIRDKKYIYGTGVLSITQIPIKFMYSSDHNSKQNYSISSHAQDITAVNPNEFLTVIYQLLVINI